jgi:hypothetical protein
LGEEPVEILKAAVQDGVVPGILAIVILGAALAPRRLSKPERRRGARIGFWGGLTVTAFVIVVVGVANRQDQSAVPPDAVVWPAINGGVVAAIIVVIVSQGVGPATSRRIGGLVFFMSATSSTSLCFYFAVPASRVIIAPFLLSALAMLLFFCAVVPELVRTKSRPPIIYH